MSSTITWSWAANSKNWYLYHLGWRKTSNHCFDWSYWLVWFLVSYHDGVVTWRTVSVIHTYCIRVFFFTFLMSSSVWISGERPPCTHRNCWFIRAARGRQSNASMQESYTCSEYLILPGGGWRDEKCFSIWVKRSSCVCFHTLEQRYSESLSVGVRHKTHSNQEAEEK